MKKEALLYEKLNNNTVRCFMCSHFCGIKDGCFGKCGVRKNEKGILYSLTYGEAAAVNTDPIEKKPLYHFLPGTRTYSIASIGCNFKCGFCQNWQISQLKANGNSPIGNRYLPKDIVDGALRDKCESISYTYTEPTVFFEYAFDTAKLANERGLYNIFVTNGFMTKRAVDKIKFYLDAANIDLKCFDDELYKKICDGRLDPVLDSIEYMKACGIWVEITTLVIPGINDSEPQIDRLTDFIAKVDKDMPWHISAFHPSYKYREHAPTTAASLKKIKDIGASKGIKYIYPGNVIMDSDTNCFKCGEKLIKRKYFQIKDIKIKKNKCPACNSEIKGVWE